MFFDAEFYQILGVKSNSSEQEIKQAFKKKAMELHPDKNRNDPKATEKFQQLNEAYETLKDPLKRKKYDELNKRPEPTFKKTQSENVFTSNIYEELLRNLFGFRRNANSSSNQYSRNSYHFNFYDSDDIIDSDDIDDSDDTSDSDDDDDEEIDTIFLGGLPHSTTEKDLINAYASFNPYRTKVVDNSLFKPAFGFVQFFSAKDMREAMRERPRIYINGKICRPKVSHTNLYARSSRRGRFHF